MTTGTLRPGTGNTLTDVAGLRVGHATGDRRRCADRHHGGGRAPAGMIAGVDVRGGGPGTRETDLLAPTASVERITAITLTGGSAYGLAAADGVATALADRGLGLAVGAAPGEVVPLVPAAVIFDLGRGGRFRATPDAATGRAALDAALDDTGTPVPMDGCVGAGTGALAGGLKGGIGSASVVLPDGHGAGCARRCQRHGLARRPEQRGAPRRSTAAGRRPGRSGRAAVGCGTRDAARGSATATSPRAARLRPGGGRRGGGAATPPSASSPPTRR